MKSFEHFPKDVASRANAVQRVGQPTKTITDNRPQTIIQRKLQNIIQNRFRSVAQYQQATKRTQGNFFKYENGVSQLNKNKIYLDKDVDIKPGQPDRYSVLAEALKIEELGGVDFSLATTLGAYLDELGYSKDAKFRQMQGESFPETGWKFHISAYSENAFEVAKAVLPILIQYNVNHKVDVSTGWTSPQNPSQLGKFITAYPSNDEVTVQVADLLNQKLQKLGQPGLVIPNEYQAGDSGILYMRHGQLAACLYEKYKKDDLPAKPSGAATAQDFKIPVSMKGAASLYVNDGIIYFKKESNYYPAMYWRGHLQPDYRDSPNPLNAMLPEGMSFFE